MNVTNIIGRKIVNNAGEYLCSTSTLALDSHGRRCRTVSSRVGQVAVRHRALVMPTVESLGLWLGGMRRTYGGTVSLAVATVLQTALRKAELVGLRIDSIPRDPREWTVVNPLASPESQSILVTVRYGTKGRDYGTDNGDKIGPAREILVPLELAKQINQYVAQDWPRALQKLLANYKGAELRVKLNDPPLFLDERTGERLTYDRFTHCWRSAPNVPCPARCPHRGRHWWACMTLWRGIKEREAAIRIAGALLIRCRVLAPCAAPGSSVQPIRPPFGSARLSAPPVPRR